VRLSANARGGAGAPIEAPTSSDRNLACCNGERRRGTDDMNVTGDPATLVVAHRGASAEATENSLGAFEKAIQVGSDLIEFDVRRTRDDQLIAFHDARVGRHLVAQLTREEIHLQTGIKPPLLDDVLDLTKGRVGLDVELKEDGYTDRVLQAIDERFEPDQLVITSFIDSVVAEAKRLTPAIRAGLLIGRARPEHLVRTRLSELFPAPRARACGADFIAMHGRLADLGALSRADGAGFAAYIWTVNDDDRMRRYLADARVRAVITDRPRRALQLRTELLAGG
jgi:glycerophosphoryl diester phosphodiesterase